MFGGKRSRAAKPEAHGAVIDRGSFQVSYNSSLSSYQSKTTSIVYHGIVFLTLNGDHRTELGEISQKRGLQGCFDYFLANIDQANHRSGGLPVLRGDITNSCEKDARQFLGAENIARLSEALKRSRRAKQRIWESDISVAM